MSQLQSFEDQLRFSVDQLRSFADQLRSFVDQMRSFVDQMLFFAELMWSFVEPMRSFVEQMWSFVEQVLCGADPDVVPCGADVFRYRLINSLIIKTNVFFLPRPTTALSRPAAVYSELSINL